MRSGKRPANGHGPLPSPETRLVPSSWSSSVLTGGRVPGRLARGSGSVGGTSSWTSWLRATRSCRGSRAVVATDARYHLGGRCRLGQSRAPACVHGALRPRGHQVHLLRWSFRRNRRRNPSIATAVAPSSLWLASYGLARFGFRVSMLLVRVSRADVVQSKSTGLGSSDWPRAYCRRGGKGTRKE